MFGSTVLEVAIGIIFIYLLLSLVCSVVNEWIAGILALRAKNLAAGIKNLLQDDKGTAVAKAIYNHSLIQGLSKTSQKPSTNVPATTPDVPPTAVVPLKGKDGPSYIPARTFAIALMDNLGLLLPSDPNADSTARVNTQVKIVNDISGLDPTLKQGIIALIKQANGNIALLQQNIENWFDDAMDRVSGWYKRQAQVLLFCLGLGLALAVNADTVYIADTLMHNDAMRSSIVSEAGKISSQGQPPKEAKEVFDELKKVPLPIGWSEDPEDKKPTGLVMAISTPGAGMRIVGWLLTAAALSLGAPFWFDMLNKVMRIRLAGNTPAEKGKVPPPENTKAV